MFSADLGGAAPASAPAATDPPFQKVALLLHGDGTNGAQNNTFVDSSSNNFTITRNGNTTQGSFSPYGNLWSNYFDGSGDWLSSAANTAFDFGTGDWTVECWFNISGNSAANANSNLEGSLFSLNSGSSSSSFNLTVSGDASKTGTGIQVYKSTNTVVDIKKTVSISQQTWNHVAVTKSSNTIRVFLNGSQLGTSNSDSTAWGNATQTPVVGRQGWPVYLQYFNGYISNLRVVKGTSLYTSNFTPSTTPLTAVSGTSLLTCQSNRFMDNSSNNFTLTVNGNTSVQRFSPFNPTVPYSTATIGGSGYFDGTGDYLTVTGNSNFSTTEDFTLEALCYASIASTYQGIVSLMSATSPNNGASINILSNGKLRFGITGADYQDTNVPLNQWFHVALVRSGSATNNCSCYLNGARVGQLTSTGQASGASNALSIGKYYADGSVQYLLTGYVADVRYVVGSALYSGATLTVPTVPLTAVSNTQLLYNFTNAGIYDNSSNNNIETVGNAQVSTSVKKYGTGSLAFDGTGDWLLLADRPALQLGTGNFTVEGWLYLGVTGAARGIVGKGASTTGWLLSTNSSNQVVFTYASNTITSTGTLAGSTWYHIAVCREGTGTNQTKIYINGTNDGTGTVSTDFNQTSVMYVGADRTGSSVMNGYIDDLRITKGQALYTSNFTPPTQAFPNV